MLQVRSTLVAKVSRIICNSPSLAISKEMSDEELHEETANLLVKSLPQLEPIARITSPIEEKKVKRFSKMNPKAVLLPEVENVEVDYERVHILELLRKEDIKTFAESLPTEQRRDLPRVTAYCTSEELNTNELIKFLQEKHSVYPRIFDECLYTQYDWIYNLPSFVYEPENPNAYHGYGEVFYFEYGCIVFWNMTEEQEDFILTEVRHLQKGSLLSKDIVIEDFHFQYYDKLDQSRIYNDMITLKQPDPMIKLTLSHGFAQSVKLTLYEEIMSSTLNESQAVPDELALTGDISFSKTQIARTCGKLYDVKMKVNLVSSVLDIPDFFWSNPDLQVIYDRIKLYMQIPQRVELLNTRTAVLSDLLDMLASHSDVLHIHLGKQDG
eukprot:NODE_138_length_16264_cov_1.140860.p6 type:complete len:382 gc:universal NODE_138_length_16264_cov_1.140860:13029-11884(-)